MRAEEAAVQKISEQYQEERVGTPQWEKNDEETNM